MASAYLRGRRDAATLLLRFDDSGQPCGNSYISPDFECRVGAAQAGQAEQTAQQSQGAMPARAKSTAKGILSAARGFEPAITSTLEGVAKVAGGELVGLQHRLKAEDSLTRKILTKAESAAIAPEQVRITDALRYTMQVDEERYTDSIRDTVTKLEAQGVNLVELENNWDKGDAYNGVNALFEQKGTIFELQFHTPSSSEVKHQAHPHYEEFRLPETPPARRKELFDRMVAIADSAPQPKGIMDLEIGVKRFRPFNG